MASFRLSTIPTATSSTTTNPNSHLLNPHAKKAGRNGNAAEDATDKTLGSSDNHNIGRRNLLMGVGGLYATANLTTLSPSLAAALANISDSGDQSAGNVEFPVRLDKTVKVLVKRPAVNRTKEEKAKATEVLMVNGITFDSEKFVKFDVLVNDADYVPAINPTDSEFAGSFAMVPQYKGPGSEKMMMTSGAKFGITELLEDLKAEDDGYVLVSLVPKTGGEDVTVSEIKIELLPNV